MANEGIEYEKWTLRMLSADYGDDLDYRIDSRGRVICARNRFEISCAGNSSLCERWLDGAIYRQTERDVSLVTNLE